MEQEVVKVNIIQRFSISASIVLLSGVFSGCDPTVHCPSGAYTSFGIDRMNGIRYSVSRNELSIWLSTTQRDKKGYRCLPEDLSVQNLSAPEVCNVGVFPPSYVHGRPLMALYVKNVSQIKRNESIEFDLFQKDVKKQSVHISVDFENAPKVVVSIDGHRQVARRVR